MQTESPFQFTLTHLLGVTAYIAFALGMGRWTGSPGIAVQLLLLLLGWGTWRFAHGYLGGVIPSLLGIDILICGGVDWAYYGNYSDFMDFRIEFLAFGSILVILGLCVFALRAYHRRPYWRAQVGVGVFLIVILISWWAIVPAMGKAAVALRQASETAANNAAKTTAIAQIEAIRKRLGRVPSESEVTDLLKEPLPIIQVAGIKSRIEYRRTKVDEYELTFFYWDIFIYNSSVPQKGWDRIPF